MRLFTKVKGLFSNDSTKTVNLQESIRFLESFRGDDRVTESTAFFQHVWVYVCINSIAQNIARVPFKIYKKRQNKEDDLQEVTSGTIYDLFHNVSPFLNSFQLFEGIEVFKNMKGEAFIYIMTEGRIPSEFAFLNPSSMRQIIEDKRLIGWQYNEGTTNLSLMPEEVIQLKYFNPANAVRGLSPLGAAMKSVNVDESARQFDQALLENGSYAGGVLEHQGELSDAQYKRLRKQWEKRHKGSKNAGKIAILEGGAKYQQLKLTLEEVQFIEQRKMSRDEIGAIYKVPPIEMNDWAQATLNNSKEQISIFWNRKLVPEMQLIEAEFQTSFFDIWAKDLEGHFDLKNVAELQDSLAEKIKSAERIWKMGVPLWQINKKLELGFELDDFESAKIPLLPFNLGNAEDLVTNDSKTDDDSDLTEPAEEEPVEPDIDEDEAEKFLKMVTKKDDQIEQTKKNFKYWKAFVNQIRPLEVKFRKALSKYTFELRQEILKNFFRDAGEIVDAKSKIKEFPLFDKSAQIQKLNNMASPYLEEGVKVGGKIAFADLAIGTEFEIIGDNTVAFLQSRIQQIRKIVDTIDDEVQAVLTQGVKEGLGVDGIAQKLRNKLDVAVNRGRTIARTEIAGAANGGKFATYSDEHIKETEWINSFDDKVRDIHQISEVVTMGEEFSNGLKYPGDREGSGSDAGNIINCRCTARAVV